MRSLRSGRAIAPSLIAHRSFDLGPVFDHFIAIDTPVARQFLEITLPNGLTADYKPIGAAILALPFYLVTHLIFVLLVPGHRIRCQCRIPAWPTSAASLFYGLVAIFLIYRFGRSTRMGQDSKASMPCSPNCPEFCRHPAAPRGGPTRNLPKLPRFRGSSSIASYHR